MRCFSEEVAVSLCLPSPACQDRVREVINGRGRKNVDKNGNNIQSTCLKGDHWRLGHDQIKLAFYRLCTWAGNPVEMEVFNLFSGPGTPVVKDRPLAKCQCQKPDLNCTLLKFSFGLLSGIVLNREGMS
jgi:hypothetical protein